MVADLASCSSGAGCGGHGPRNPLPPPPAGLELGDERLGVVRPDVAALADEERRSPSRATALGAHDVLRIRSACTLVQVAQEALDVESHGARVARQVLRLELVLMLEEQVVHLPEPPLLSRRLWLRRRARRGDAHRAAAGAARRSAGRRRSGLEPRRPPRSRGRRTGTRSLSTRRRVSGAVRRAADVVAGRVHRLVEDHWAAPRAPRAGRQPARRPATPTASRGRARGARRRSPHPAAPARTRARG